MIVVLILLLVGVVAYLFWQSRTTTLTRRCRWREDRSFDHDSLRLFRCMSCNATTHCPIGEEPRDCLAGRKPSDPSS
jgi:hypothetical protein